jgi:hypothetical protein
MKQVDPEFFLIVLEYTVDRSLGPALPVSFD